MLWIVAIHRPTVWLGYKVLDYLLVHGGRLGAGAQDCMVSEGSRMEVVLRCRGLSQHTPREGVECTSSDWVLDCAYACLCFSSGSQITFDLMYCNENLENDIFVFVLRIPAFS